jgi:hypothetical protein
LPVSEHPTLHAEVVREFGLTLLGVFTELQEKGREQLSRGGIAGDPSKPLVEAAREGGGVQHLPDRHRRLAVGVGSGHLPEHRPMVVAPRGEDVQIPDRAGQGALDVVPSGARQPAEIPTTETDGGGLDEAAEDQPGGGGERGDGWHREADPTERY